MCVCVPRRVFFSIIAHVLGKSKLEDVCDLGIHILWGFPKVVRQFVVNFLSREPFIRICEFCSCFFCEPTMFYFYDFFMNEQCFL